MATAAKTDSVTEGWPQWKIALALGVPAALGVAVFWYYKKDKKSQTKPRRDNSEERLKTSNEDDESKTDDPLLQAQTAKNKGNKYFKGSKFAQAIECYTRAIEICPADKPTELATFYQNRAAAQEQLGNVDKVISDSSKALALNCKYVKALFRRARAYDKTEQLTECLEDLTAVCILEGFQNQQSLLMADRVLKSLGKSKASKAFKNREAVEPSPQFIRTYFSAFANDPILNSLTEPPKQQPTTPTTTTTPLINKDGEPLSPVAPPTSEAGDEKHQDETSEKEMVEQPPSEGGEAYTGAYERALDCLRRRQYTTIVSLCTQALAQSRHTAEVLLLRATFYLLRGEGNLAMKDFDTLLAMDDVNKRIRSNALIKRGSLCMQNGQQQDALADFAKAIVDDPENSDIYHHRGQLHLLVDQVDDALKDFQKSVTLSPQFAIAHVQKCYTEYRLAYSHRNPLELQKAMKSFEDTLAVFPNCAEGYALYGQALCDQQMHSKADEHFKKAMELESDNGNIYVHRGLLRLQWKQDIDEASSLINMALKVDNKCEFAYETLGTIEVQRGYLQNAIELFNKAISLAKTEVEMAHLFSLLDAAIAQSRVADKLGIKVPTIADMML